MSEDPTVQSLEARVAMLEEARTALLAELAHWRELAGKGNLRAKLGEANRQICALVTGQASWSDLICPCSYAAMDAEAQRDKYKAKYENEKKKVAKLRWRIHAPKGLPFDVLKFPSGFSIFGFSKLGAIRQYGPPSRLP